MNVSSYDAQGAAVWMRSHRVRFVLLDALYLAFVHYVPSLLAHRRKPQLRTVMLLWNAFGFVTNLGLLLLLTPDFIASFYNGLYGSVCLNRTLYTSPLSGPAIFKFHVGKSWSLLETVLLVVRGRPLLPLHVFHHAVTLLIATFTYYRTGAVARWGVMMNLGSHVLMYGYFCAQTLMRQVPRRWASVVTVLQTAQFLVGALVLMLTKRYVAKGFECHVSPTLLNVNLFVSVVFFVLFTHFYITKFCFVETHQSQQGQRQTRLKTA